ncbi:MULTISPECIES: YjcZ family sporulation protein [Cytobacillus]|uniref:YjcZ family sporulation protein n=1 Tax=Cytobacillus stercorigallinarum TaxID=2762240 RepID=A0ABR8QKF9_9BACI|nr:YjcZ family sporulation protein [Cytobacillus stercorigallinarum]MBD7936010.1 YjcZ family sporulation protein [Cytobacillus stercorigallinarum]
MSRENCGDNHHREDECYGGGFGAGFALIVVLFILLIIVGASWLF